MPTRAWIRPAATEYPTRRELRWLRLHALVSTAMFAVLVLGGFHRASEKVRFDEVDVERLNVVEKDGRVRLVLANAERSPGVILSGRSISQSGGRAGMIFYNDEGDENGGLIFRGRKVDGEVSAGGHLSFDRYGQDQVIALTYQEEKGRHSQGLTILDRPPQSYLEINARRDSINRMAEGPAKEAARRAWVAWQGGAAFGAPRLFIGRNTGKQAVLDLKDQTGRSRLRLAVDSLGAARIEFLDDSGRVTHRLPDEGRTTPGVGRP
jgi:hypothetical protein